MNSNADNPLSIDRPGIDRLEAREVLVWPTAPMPLPSPDECEFLRSLLPMTRSSGVVWLDGSRGGDGERRDLHGLSPLPDPADENRVRDILTRFQTTSTAWVKGLLPEYAEAIQVQPATFRPCEEAFRSQTLSGRNDLLHIDHFTRRPTWGARILRLFVNIHPSEDRVWMLSEPLERILPMISHRLPVPPRTPAEWLKESKSLSNFLTGRPRSAYDAWMTRLRDILKADDTFQDRAARRVEHFAPGSAWMLFSDATAHAVLRGQFALEQTWLVPVKALLRPEMAPINILAAKAGDEVRRKAA